MRGLRTAVVILLLLLGGGVLGCGGGGAKLETTTSTVTLGKQLLDLDNAYKTGAIDEKQYNKVKKGLLNKYK